VYRLQISESSPTLHHDVPRDDIIMMPAAKSSGPAVESGHDNRSQRAESWYSNAARIISEEMPKARDAAAVASHAMQCGNQHCREVAETLAAVVRLLEVKDEMIWHLLKDRGELLATRRKYGIKS
jgi:hypothetical protein